MTVTNQTHTNIMTETMPFVNRSQAMKSTGLSYIGGINTSSKIMKNLKKNNIDTYIIYLAPADMSGYNVCPQASAECKSSCLAGSGHNRINTDGCIDRARIKKTKMYFENRQFFTDWTIAEITAHKAKSELKGHGFSIRINGTSDINIETLKSGGKNLFEIFPDVQFYDYTKVANRSKLLDKYKNLDLTYSYSGTNWLECEAALSNGMRVAAVFETVPAFYHGIEVINGDETDLRYLDANNVIVGLKFKKIKNKPDFTKQKFVIQANDIHCTY